MPITHVAATAIKAEKCLKSEADDAMESPTKKIKTLIDVIEAERLAWMEEKAKMQTELDVSEAQREALTKDKAALQSEKEALLDNIQNQEELAFGHINCQKLWAKDQQELKSLKIGLAKEKKENKQLEIALINYRKIQGIVKNTETTAKD